MKKNIDLYERIENYLEGNLSSDEKRMLEHSMQHDSVLQEMVNQHTRMHQFIFESSLHEVRQNLQYIHRRNKTNQWHRYLKTGGATIGLLAIFFCARYYTSQKTRPELSTNPVVQYDSTTLKQSHSIPIKKNTLPIYNTQEPEVAPATCQVSKNADQALEVPVIIPVPDTTFEQTTSESEPSLPSFEPLVHTLPTGKPNTKNPENTEQKTEGLSSAVNCDTVILHAAYVCSKSCSDKANGSIHFSSETTGGTPPYQYSINNGLDYFSQTEFTHLSCMHYSLWVKDAHNCTTQIDRMYLESKDCSYDEVFAPLEGEQWEVPTDDKPAVLYIFAQQGMLVFQHRIDEGMTFQWNGTSNSNNPLPMGAYAFVLEFDTHETFHGTITIIR